MEYKLRKGIKTKRLSISIRSDLSIVVSAPYFVSQKVIEKFLESKKTWINKSINFYKNRTKSFVDFDLDKKKREEIKDFVLAKIEKLNAEYNYSYNKVFIKNHRSRWGSCSGARNLNFNYRIISLPEHLAEYIIVHELCHLGEMNHSQRFWDLVAKTIPDHKERRKELKKIIF